MPGAGDTRLSVTPPNDASEELLVRPGTLKDTRKPAAGIPPLHTLEVLTRCHRLRNGLGPGPCPTRSTDSNPSMESNSQSDPRPWNPTTPSVRWYPYHRLLSDGKRPLPITTRNDPVTSTTSTAHGSKRC